MARLSHMRHALVLAADAAECKKRKCYQSAIVLLLKSTDYMRYAAHKELRLEYQRNLMCDWCDVLVDDATRIRDVHLPTVRSSDLKKSYVIAKKRLQDEGVNSFHDAIDNSWWRLDGTRRARKRKVRAPKRSSTDTVKRCTKKEKDKRSSGRSSQVDFAFRVASWAKNTDLENNYRAAIPLYFKAAHILQCAAKEQTEDDETDYYREGMELFTRRAVALCNKPKHYHFDQFREFAAEAAEEDGEKARELCARAIGQAHIALLQELDDSTEKVELIEGWRFDRAHRADTTFD